MQISQILDQSVSFEADVDAQIPTIRVSANTIERVRALFASIRTTISHASSAEACGLESERTMYLIRVAFQIGRLSEIFKGMRRQGWVDRAIALCRVVENAATRRNRPV